MYTSCVRVAKIVFISHATEDKEIAQRACSLLEQEGVACWIAPRDIEPTANYPAEIQRGINSSTMMLLFYSRHVSDSQWVLREVERAVNVRLPILPVLLDGSAMEGDFQFLLGVCQWLDATPKSPNFYDCIIQGCRRVLKRNEETSVVKPPVIEKPAVPTEDADLDELFTTKVRWGNLFKKR